MAQKERRLSVVLSRKALAALDQIWEWNARNYNVAHANAYVDFLRSETEKLADTYAAGRVVPNRPELQYLLIKRRRRKGHGHVAVYQVIGQTVHVLEYFHTAQDWPAKLKK